MSAERGTVVSADVPQATEPAWDAGLPDFRRLPIRDAIRYLEAHGDPPDPRTDIDTASLVAAYPGLARVTVTDHVVEGPHGPQPARLYRDPSQPARAGLVWVHGGGFIGGRLDMPESHWVALTLASHGVSVLTADYHKALNGVHFPVPSDDVLAAWEWATGRADLLGVPAARLHLGGASAGGNLVAGVVARLRDAGRPLPASVVLVYAVMHSVLPEPSPELGARLAEAGIDPSPEHGRVLNENFVGSVEALDDPYAFAGQGDVSGLPPVYVLNADMDALRSSGEEYARQVAEAGGEVLVELEPGARHGHLDRPYSAEGCASVERLAAWLTGTRS